MTPRPPQRIVGIGYGENIDRLHRERITAMRLAAGWSQGRLAYELNRAGWSGVTEQAVQQIEAGKRRRGLTQTQLVYFSRVFGTGDWTYKGVGLPWQDVYVQGATAEAHAADSARPSFG